ncbi:MAG: hypothetical protein EDX89_02435 [Acidobacteria bacterium]|nr:MAG: hypothetical protein EDX89_02435 [Acidobacteriota bacterium]
MSATPDRLETLEARVASLSGELSRLRDRLDALEGRAASSGAASGDAGAAPGATPGAAAEAPAATAPGGTSLVALGGRGFLIVGGAYLFRALTEAGTLPAPLGVAAGLAYAAGWAVVAGRAGKEDRAAGTFYGLLSLLLGLPLVWEAATRLSALPPAAAAAGLAALGALVFAVAWRRDLGGLAWAATVGTVGTAFGLLVGTRRVELFAWLLIALGAAVLWATYGRRWHGLRWPAAIGADLAILVLVVLAGREGGPAEAYADLSPARAAVAALALFVVYVGSFAVRTLVRQRSVVLFEAVQAPAALLVGFGGAVELAGAAGTGTAALGVAALVLAAGAYGVAFAFLERQAEGARNFLFYTSLALVLALSGGALLAGGALPVVWTAIGLVAVAAGTRFRRVSLCAHAAVYLWSAAFASGLVGPAVRAFAGRTAGAEDPVGRAALLVVGAALAALAARLVSARTGAGPLRASVAPFAIGLLFLTGSSWVATAALARLLPGSPDAAAAARTAIAAALAVLFAALRARGGPNEAGWLAWTALGLTTLRAVLVELPAGRPAALFATFVLVGGALVLVARLLRQRAVPASG